jgi:hypothetical protein
MRRFPRSVLEEFPKEFAVFKNLRTPADVQDFLNGLKQNFETEGETYYSPLMVLKNGKAHCMEGAVLAAAALWHQGRPPLLMDLKTTDDDVDHVVALFKERNKWGALSKTNHAVLRYREAIYKDPRELAMSYFHEYFLHSGVKTLRSYSEPLSLLDFEDDWLTATEDLVGVVEALDFSKHFPILDKPAIKRLRLAEDIEIKAGKIVDQSPSSKKVDRRS